MANCGSVDGLDLALSQATNPLDRELNLDAVQKLCQLILLSRDAPQEVLRIIAHKVQSPQEREALRALEVLEECVARCGGKLNNEVGKFRFLNELIRVVSPKYLGQRAPESVKRRVVEMLYKWSVVLSHETKIVDAYAMLKRQGVVEEDPIHVLPREEETDRIEPPPPREDEIFTDKQKELELKRLLGSKNPEDLQAANRLIKTMVKEADRKMDLKSRKLLDLQEASNNCAVFSSLLNNFHSDMKRDELELLQQMFENCDKLRPKLFTLASEFSFIEDFPSVQEVLQQNDELTALINKYKDRVAPIIKKLPKLPDPPVSSAAAATNSADDGDSNSHKCAASTAPALPVPTVTVNRDEATSSSCANDHADDHLSFDPLSSSKSPNQDDVSLLDSQVSSLAVSPTTETLISIDESTSKQNDLLSLMDLALVSEPPTVVTPSRLQPTAAVTPTQTIHPEISLQPVAVLTKSPDPTPTQIPAPTTQPKTYAPFEGLDTLMSEKILATRPEPPPTCTNLCDLEEIALADIVPSTQPPLVLSCQEDITTILHVTENRIADDVVVVLLTTTNRNAKAAVKNFSCLVTSPGGQARPLTPSGDQLPVFNASVPSMAITHIVLLQKSQPELRIAFTITYTLVLAGGKPPTPVTISGEKQL